MTQKLWRIENDELRVSLHPGQYQAMASQRRFIAMFAGTQGGKTSFIPWWLASEIDRCGAGDYLAVTATFDLFKLKFLPTMREVFEQLLGIGRYWPGGRVIELRNPQTGQFEAHGPDDPMWGRIILRSAESPAGLESSTANAAALDEAGLYPAEVWPAIQRRLSLQQGRALMGTTIYDLGWVKTEIYDKWVAGDTDYEVIQFDSTLNPSFPKEEYERARRDLPTWKFNMFYRGMFERPAGLIYDSFDEADVVSPFELPKEWPRFVGLDFGGVNTAALFYAEEPETGRLFLYREYKAGGRTAAEHTRSLLEGEPMMPYAVGGSHSEEQWRREFRKGGRVGDREIPGLLIREPDVKEVEIGIERVYGAHRRHEIVVFNSCTGYLAEKRSYARKVDSAGEPTELIDAKQTFHFMDAERYIVGYKKRTVPKPVKYTRRPY